MTKEELEKEKCRLERKLEQTEKDLADYQFNYPTIKELQEENERLKKSNLEMLSFYEKKLNKNIELEKQIEKMKCCYNCKHSRTVYEHCRTDKHEKWEIKEK